MPLVLRSFGAKSKKKKKTLDHKLFMCKKLLSFEIESERNCADSNNKQHPSTYRNQAISMSDMFVCFPRCFLDFFFPVLFPYPLLWLFGSVKRRLQNVTRVPLISHPPSEGMAMLKLSQSSNQHTIRRDGEWKKKTCFQLKYLKKSTKKMSTVVQQSRRCCHGKILLGFPFFSI